MKSAYVVSDLHMFCRRSQWRELLETIHDVAKTADLFVFNGDTFDFKWTSLDSVETTVERSIAFLRELAKRCPKCHFHINLGNHDHAKVFVDALEKLARKTPNLSWHPYYLRVGSTLFLHGDVAMRKMTQEELERYRERRLYRHKKRGSLRNRVYDAVLKTGAHVTVSRLAYPRRRTAKRVSAYLEDIGHSYDDGVKHVYFGHTHVPMSNYTYGGMTFNNGGAPFKGMRCILLKAKL